LPQPLARGVPGFAESRATGHSHHQSGAERRLQFLQHAGRGWLCQAKGRRRGTECAKLVDQREQSQVAHLEPVETAAGGSHVNFLSMYRQSIISMECAGMQDRANKAGPDSTEPQRRKR
jgi:hypothetical protein